MGLEEEWYEGHGMPRPSGRQWMPDNVQLASARWTVGRVLTEAPDIRGAEMGEALFAFDHELKSRGKEPGTVRPRQLTRRFGRGRVRRPDVVEAQRVVDFLDVQSKRDAAAVSGECKAAVSEAAAISREHGVVPDFTLRYQHITAEVPGSVIALLDRNIVPHPVLSPIRQPEPEPVSEPATIRINDGLKGNIGDKLLGSLWFCLQHPRSVALTVGVAASLLGAKDIRSGLTYDYMTNGQRIYALGDAATSLQTAETKLQINHTPSGTQYPDAIGARLEVEGASNDLAQVPARALSGTKTGNVKVILGTVEKSLSDTSIHRGAPVTQETYYMERTAIHTTRGEVQRLESRYRNEFDSRDRHFEGGIYELFIGGGVLIGLGVGRINSVRRNLMTRRKGGLLVRTTPLPLNRPSVYTLDSSQRIEVKALPVQSEKSIPPKAKTK